MPLPLITDKIIAVYKQYKMLAVQAIFYQDVAKCKVTFYYKLLFGHSSTCSAIPIELNFSHCQKLWKYITKNMQQKKKKGKTICSLQAC